MCPNTKAFFGTTTPKDCAACNAFMTDLSLIAQYDPSHFKVKYKAMIVLTGRVSPHDIWPIKNYFSKSSVPSAPKSVPNWEVLKLKFVSERSKILKKMSETLSLVPTPNKSAKPLCFVNKFIHSDTVNFILRFEFIVIVSAHLISSLR